MTLQTFNRKFIFNLFCLSLGLLLVPAPVMGYANFANALGCPSKKMLACEKHAFQEDNEIGSVRLTSLEKKIDSEV